MSVNFPESPYPGELVTDDASGRVWRWEEDQTRWVLIRQYYIPVPGPAGPAGPPGVPGPIGVGQRGPEGPTGQDGPAGFGINIVGEVETIDDLPDAQNVSNGDAYWVTGNSTLSVKSTTGEFVHNIDVKGPKGDNGDTGLTGESGDPGVDGEDGLAICEVVSFAPSRGPKGKLFIDNLNRIYVTTGL